MRSCLSAPQRQTRTHDGAPADGLIYAAQAYGAGLKTRHARGAIHGANFKSQLCKSFDITVRRCLYRFGVTFPILGLFVSPVVGFARHSHYLVWSVMRMFWPMPEKQACAGWHQLLLLQKCAQVFSSGCPLTNHDWIMIWMGLCDINEGCCTALTPPEVTPSLICREL